MAARYRRSEHALWRQAHGTVLVHAASHGDDDVVVLEGTGVDLWAVVDDELSVTEIAHRLAAVYDTTAAAIAIDIEPVLDGLVARGVVDRIEA